MASMIGELYLESFERKAYNSPQYYFQNLNVTSCFSCCFFQDPQAQNLFSPPFQVKGQNRNFVPNRFDGQKGENCSQYLFILTKSMFNLFYFLDIVFLFFVINLSQLVNYDLVIAAYPLSHSPYSHLLQTF